MEKEPDSTMNEFLEKKNIDRTNSILGFSVMLFTLIIYLKTLAPTLSFWDCGEFIASSKILGVPHPPGTPLYILIGRLFTILPTYADMAARINFLSALSSAFTAMFGYLINVRILRNWFSQDQSTLNKLLIYGGGISGALFLAFSLTNWNNSIEAEVYGLSMMVLLAMFWLTLIYAENKGTPFGNRIMLFVIYLGLVGIGIHMTTFLIMPVVSLFFILKKEADQKVWYAIAALFFMELFLIFALSSQVGEIPFYFPTMIVFIIFLFFIFSFEQIPKLYMFALLGFALSIIPLLGDTIALISKTPDASGSFQSVLELIGKISSGLLLVFGLYSFYKYSIQKGKDESLPFLYVSLFVFAAVIMTVMLFLLKGYTAFLVISAIMMLGLLWYLWRYIAWANLIAVASISLVIIGVKPFFYGMGIACLILVIGGLAKKLPGWKTALLIIVVAIAGYSVHLFIPIRSAQQPIINENNPSKNLTTTINYLERKQYGSQSMVERMFIRRAEWSNQFGRFSRMGFWSFFERQYGLPGPQFILLLLLGVFGIWEVIRRNPQNGLSFLILFLISTAGLILYMNFADGTRDGITGIDYLEVRDRDYFFTPGFILFGMGLGIGISILIQFIKDSIEKFPSAIKNTTVYASLVLFLIPGFTIANNYFECDRSRNYLAYDYAENILKSADENAILFTNGDNDTFPVWCLQEAFDYRKDVVNINLSLANTKWYIKQLKNTMGVDLGWSDEQIDKLRPYRTQDGTIFRLNHQVIDAVINKNYGKRPINFSVTNSSSVRRYRGKSIDKNLILQGMSWRVDFDIDAMGVDKERSIEFYLNPDKFQSRGVNDNTIFKNETELRLTRNYANGILMVADHLRRLGDSSMTEILVKSAVDRIPYSDDAYEYLGRWYSDRSKTDEIKALIEENEFYDNNMLQVYLARSEINSGRKKEGETILVDLLNNDPNFRAAFEELMRFYYNNNLMMNLRSLLKGWLGFNPDDQKIKQLLTEFEKELLRRQNQETSGQ